MPCRQPDIEPESEARGAAMDEVRRTAEASLNGIRSNPALAHLASEEAAELAVEDARALLRGVYDQVTDDQR